MNSERIVDDLHQMKGWIELLLSKYVLQIPLNDEAMALYNTMNGAIVEVKAMSIDNDKLKTDQFSDEEVHQLVEMGFFISTEGAINYLRETYDDSHKLTISVEITDCCNLRCPYCYQGDHVKKTMISEEAIEQILLYVTKVYERNSYNHLHLVVLGGEPSLAKKQFFMLVNSVQTECNKMGVKFTLSIDTNGTQVKYLEDIPKCESIGITIPLSYKQFHDSVRRDAAGDGTYDRIIENINWVYENLPYVNVNIRHNTDGDNYLRFSDFISDIRKKLIRRPNVFINYTLELSNEFHNKLLYFDYVDWKSTKAIDVLIENDIDILFAPLILMDRCTMNEPYSMKVTNDLKVVPCAMFFAEPDKISLQAVSENIDLLYRRYAKEKNYSVLKQPCRNCRKLFLCGGGKLPCFVANYGDSQCSDHISHGVNAELFIKRYLYYADHGKEELFAYFLDPTPRR